MNSYTDGILVIILLSVLLSLASSRIMTLIRIMALQGAMVSLVPIFLEPGGISAGNSGALLFAMLMLVVKGGLIPGLLCFAMAKVSIKREVEPLISYHISLAIGLGIMLLAMHLTQSLGLPLAGGRRLVLIAAFTTIGGGLFLMMSRTKAITQVIGYLMLENGIYLVGATLAKHVHNHYIVEFGILLDLLVAVMLMGIILNNINRTFDDVDTLHLEQLKG